MNQTQFETEVRTSLHNAADSFLDLDLDPMSVITDGSRVVRRRRIGQAVAGATAAALVAVGAWAVTSRVEDGNALPAGPSPSVTAAPGWTSATLENTGKELEGAPTPAFGPPKFTVSFNPSVRGADNVRYSAVADNGTQTQVATATVDPLAHPLATSWITRPEWKGHILVGLLPKDAGEFQVVTPLDPKGGHASNSSTADIPGSPFKAFAVFFEEPDAATVTDVIAHLGDRRVIDAKGAVVPSVQLVAANGSAESTTAFLTDTSLGTFSPDGSSRVELGQFKAGDYPVIFQSRLDSGHETGQYVIALPKGATQVKATATGLTMTTSPQIGTLGEHTLVGFNFSATAGASRGVTIEWTDAAGQRHSHKS